MDTDTIALSYDEIREIVWAVVRDVAELPDRTSPPDEPMLMLVTEQELADILIYRLSASVRNSQQTSDAHDDYRDNK